MTVVMNLIHISVTYPIMAKQCPSDDVRCIDPIVVKSTGLIKEIDAEFNCCKKKKKVKKQKKVVDIEHGNAPPLTDQDLDVVIPFLIKLCRALHSYGVRYFAFI